MKDKNVPLELIQQLRAWIDDNATRRETDTIADQLRTVYETIRNLEKMSVEIPIDLKRKRRELESAMNAPRDDEQFLNEIAEELLRLANYIKRGERGINTSTKAPPKVLCVTLPDGRVIRELKAVDTFIETLRLMGLGKCASITDVQQYGHPVVSTRPNPNKEKNRDSIKKVDGYFVETHSSTEVKAKLLETYAQALGMRIKVETFEA